MSPLKKKKDFIYLFLERGKEREGEKHQCVVASLVRPPPGIWPATRACALTGNPTSDPLVHRLVLNPLSYTSQGKSTFVSHIVFTFFKLDLGLFMLHIY